MELIWANKGGNSKVIVIPTANVNQDFTQRAIKNFQSYGYDILCVQDSGEGFSFAKSMNAGITETLKNPDYKIIGLSNDDVYGYEPQELPLELIDVWHWDILTPFIVPENNEKIPHSTFTSSTLHYLFNMTVIQKAPFHAIRQIRYIKKHTKHKKFIIPMPSLNEHMCVQPTAFFKRYVLEGDQFDENFKNGVEDDDLTYRLIKKGYTFATAGTIHHITGASFKPLKMKGSNNYYGNRTHLLDNVVYFSDKHTEE
jgi:GT2 family glycosyltransferase